MQQPYSAALARDIGQSPDIPGQDHPTPPAKSAHLPFGLRRFSALQNRKMEPPLEFVFLITTLTHLSLEAARFPA